MSDDRDVHTEHCCLRHGCKYGYDCESGYEFLDANGNKKVCTVSSGAKKQSFPCESCENEIGYKIGMEVWVVEEYPHGLVSLHASEEGAIGRIAELKKNNKDTKEIQFTIAKLEVER